MEAVIFVPGILGSILLNGDEVVWPPTLMEAVGGYGRLDKLMDDDVRAGLPIKSVACKMVYQHIITDLEEIVGGQAGAPVRSLHLFGYDWRRDIRDTAGALAEFIDAIPAEQRQGIHIVAHSMGCLVSRLLLESGEFDARDWHAKVINLVALAGPHQGAPLAFVRAIGMEGSLGLSPEHIRTLSSDARYPALYQLFPAPGESVVWDTRGERVDPVDIYSPEGAERFGLNKDNLAHAAATHAILARQAKPGYVRYLYLAGTGLGTCLRVNAVGSHRTKIDGEDAGDGTVPLWSAVRGDVRHHVAPGEHSEIFRNNEIRSLLYRVLGGRMPYTPFATRDGRPTLRVVPGQPSFSPTEEIELMLVLDEPAPTVVGDLVVEFTPDLTQEGLAEKRRQPLSWNGARTSRLSFLLDKGGAPGHYRVHFSGTHETRGDGAAVFAVTVN